MTTYTYLYADEHKNLKETKEAIRLYAEQHGYQSDTLLEETKSTKVNWQKREIGTLLDSNTIKAGDMLIAYEAADLARSTSQMLEILVEATSQSLDICFVKYDEVFKAQPTNKLSDLLRMIQHIESDFISRRTTEALARRRAAGLPLGRPKGRKNKMLKLDKHKKDIIKYLELGISKASIAKLVSCHPQTLYDWIDRHGIPDKKARRPRTSAKLALAKLNEMA